MKLLLSAVVVAYFVSACATTTPAVQFDEPLAETKIDTQLPNQSANDELETMKRRYVELQGKLEHALLSRDEAMTANAELQKQLDSSIQIVDSTKQQLAAITHQEEQLAQKIADMQVSMMEIARQKEVADKNTSIYRDIVDKLHPMKEAGQVDIVMRDGRMILAMSTDILFDSGKIDIKTNGKKALSRVAQVLKAIARRKFLVAGHTDNMPIRTRQFRSNWELSTRRAVEVVHYLISQNMAPKDLVAAGYGEFQPIVQNDTKEHRTQNRRIEIVLLPDVLEPPSLGNATSLQ